MTDTAISIQAVEPLKSPRNRRKAPTAKIMTKCELICHITGFIFNFNKTCSHGQGSTITNWFWGFWVGFYSWGSSAWRNFHRKECSRTFHAAQAARNSLGKNYNFMQKFRETNVPKVNFLWIFFPNNLYSKIFRNSQPVTQLWLNCDSTATQLWLRKPCTIIQRQFFPTNANILLHFPYN